jgi:phosphoribosylformylglycinamidine cyclo-ligase
VLPEDTEAVLEPFWSVPPVFAWLASTGGIAADEMLRAFNCGIGMAVVVGDPDAASEVLRDQGESVARIGHIGAGSGPAKVRIALPAGWPG